MNSPLIPNPSWLITRAKRQGWTAVCDDMVLLYVPFLARKKPAETAEWRRLILEHLARNLPELRKTTREGFLASLSTEERSLAAWELDRGSCIHFQLHHWVKSGKTILADFSANRNVTPEFLQSYLDEIDSACHVLRLPQETTLATPDTTRPRRNYSNKVRLYHLLEKRKEVGQPTNGLVDEHASNPLDHTARAQIAIFLFMVLGLITPRSD